MKKCFPNVRGRGRPVHGRNSPRSPASPMVNQQNGQLKANTQRQVGAAARNQRQRSNLNMNGQMQNGNRLNEMFAMFNQQQQKPSNDKIE